MRLGQLGMEGVQKVLEGINYIIKHPACNTIRCQDVCIDLIVVIFTPSSPVSSASSPCKLIALWQPICLELAVTLKTFFLKSLI